MIKADFAFGHLIDAITPPHLPEARVHVRRPDDFLVFDLLFENLELKTDGTPRLVRGTAAPALLIVEFPPQSFGEEAFREKDEDLEPTEEEKDFPQEVSKDPDYSGKNVRGAPTDSVSGLAIPRVRMSGPSRLAFAMPAYQQELRYTLRDVLVAMRTWPLHLDLNAMPEPPPKKKVALGDFLANGIASPGWVSARDQLFSRLVAVGGKRIDDAIVAAGERVAERAAGGLAGGACSGVGKVMLDVMRGETDELLRRFRKINQPFERRALIAALSLAAMESLAHAAARVVVDLDVIKEVPFLPLLLAPHEPARNVTALELPYRLALSPIEQARWWHADDPVTSKLPAGRTELWHTRLRVAAGEHGPDGSSKVRVLWSPDYPISNVGKLLEPKPQPFRMSLDPLDRQMLVKLTSGYDQSVEDGSPYLPRPTHTRRLHLSALGGLLDGEGNWDTRPVGVDLQQWRHVATLGRDHYVRVVYAGFLCPFGHAASLVKVTERKFESLDGDADRRIAVLRQRFFIVVRERVKDYSSFEGTPLGRNYPFRRVEVLTRVTPDLVAPDEQNRLKDFGAVEHDGKPIPIVARMAFWPMISADADSKDFLFEVVATDIAGRRVSFSIPLAFVGELPNRYKHSQVAEAYNVEVERRRASLGGASVCYAPYHPDDLGDSRLPTEKMTFKAGWPDQASSKPSEPNFYPQMAEAQVGIPPLQKLLGRAGDVVAVEYAKAYKTSGYGSSNKAMVFLELINPHPLKFGGDPDQSRTDALGALAAPAMSIRGFSKLIGPVSARYPIDPNNPDDQVSKGTFDPADFFPDATILGAVKLAALLGTSSLDGPAAPKLLSRELPKRAESSFSWETPIIESDSNNLLIPNADPAKSTTLHVTGIVSAPLADPEASIPLADPEASTREAHAWLNNFKVNLFGFVVLWFDELQFHARKGQKPDVKVLLHPSDAIRFGGPLDFVNRLREYIPPNGFSDPPALTVTPSGLGASYSLNLPAMEVGVFMLSNASLGAGFNLPFDARPASVNFRFSERDHPFSLTVSALGGGGFVALVVSAEGVREIEAALEFGAAVAIDLGVASGGVEIKGGIYWHWLQEAGNGKGAVELEGYVRIRGELSVLGLISASLTFYLALSYDNNRKTVWGEAFLVVEVEVAFFSEDVRVRCRREFAGGNGDPKFIELIPDQETWTRYCEAFAEEPV